MVLLKITSFNSQHQFFCVVFFGFLAVLKSDEIKILPDENKFFLKEK